MLKNKQRNKNNKTYPKNKNTKLRKNPKEINERESNKNKNIMKTTSKTLKTNLSNSSSNNSSKNKKIKTKKKEKINNELDKKKEKKYDEELIKQQYKIIKDFLIPILKEQSAKELISCYNNMEKFEKRLMTKNRTISLRNKPILEYSFVTGKYRNKLKIPLFQILSPKEFVNHLDKKNRGRSNTVNRPCKNSSTTNINNMNMLSETRKIKSTNNKINTMETSGRNINKNNDKLNSNNNQNMANCNKNDIKSSLMTNNTHNNNDDEKKTQIKNTNENASKKIIENSKINNNEIVSIKKIKEKRSKTPPLYLRLNEVRQKHEEELEKLREKYEFNYNKNNNIKSSKNKDDNSSTEMSISSSSVITRNKSKNKNDFEKWYNYEKTWEKMKDMKLDIIKSEVEENKMCMNLFNKQQETFKPKINKNSENIFSQNYDENFYIRLKNYQRNKERKTKMLRQKLKPTFKPYVNVNYNVNKEYYLYMKYDQKKINKDLSYYLSQN